ncbi:hypothetical protein DXG03_009473 [Asterophora parasitica]|uniref:Uncharacterized protein n=1 Tax=Asterophora parasitica TaxID=117018 RepID=A0A9P7GBB0_9AGAR|nr:hypothetical protein DXG03_009473 [Asterophora parasitica]
MAETNSLGLDFDQLTVQADTGLTTTTDQEPTSPEKQDQAQNTLPPDTREKKKPYVNAERVKTGGSQRDKLSEEALTERMARMREQNEKIKQRRLDVQADEEAFRKTQESERIKQAQIRKVQDSVDRTREQNAKRKMDKIQSREWDSGKPTGDWKHKKTVENATTQPSQPTQPIQPTNEGKEQEAAGEALGEEVLRGAGAWVEEEEEEEEEEDPAPLGATTPNLPRPSLFPPQHLRTL